MNNKLLFIILIFLCCIYYGGCSDKTSSFNNTIKVYNKVDNKTSTINFEQYVVGVVAGEMPASFNREALKAQAVAARSFAYNRKLSSKGNYDVTSDTSSQVYINESQMKDKWKDKFEHYYSIIKDAVNETENEVIVYKGTVIKSYYFSTSNGYTEDSLNVFGTQEDYLKSVPSIGEETNKYFNYTVNFTYSNFCKLLDIDCTNVVVNNIKKNNSNRIETIVINEKQFTGPEIRKLLSLRSTDFEIKFADDIQITTKGYGHGVGMSQYGANYLASIGYNYKEILEYYYRGTEIKNINSIK